MQVKTVACLACLAVAAMSRAAAFDAQVKKITGVELAARQPTGDIPLPADYGYLDKASVVAGADGRIVEIRCRKEFPAAHSQEVVVAAAESTLKKVQGDFSVSGVDDASDGTGPWRKAVRFSGSGWTAVIGVAKAGGNWVVTLTFRRG